MHNKKWQSLRKIGNDYELELDTKITTQCSSRINFTQLAFDWEEERLAATDSAGNLYYIDLSNNSPAYQKLGNVGQATFVAFNPIDKSEILVGLTTADVKIIKVHINIVQFCLLIAHNTPPLHISFYKNYCLTSSHKEVIIWYLRSCSKAHQLRVNTRNVTVKKASFSNLGHIVALYHNDTIQTWCFNQLENDTKIDAKTFGIRNIKDFVFTRNARAMIMTGTQNKIIILNTCNWTLLKHFTLPDNFIGVKQLSMVPLALDGGANKILAVVSSNCILYFFDLNMSCIVDAKAINAVKKISVSTNGRYIAYIEWDGKLKICLADKLFSEKCVKPQKLTELCRPVAHEINDHLQCVRKNIKQELRLERLIPILKEFGEYPEKYRLMIWSTISKLPANKSAFCSLANKARSAKSTLALLENFSLTNRSKKHLLITTLNSLIQWCPLLIQCSFLPNFAFPFLMVFQKDPLLAFELILYILINYCQKWFEYHPLPPLNVLGIIENVLLEADSSLLNVFCERKITSTEYAWPLLKTAMSEVLSGSEWLILWDHLITFQNPSLFIMCVIAYSICSREIIISSVHSDTAKRFYSTQGHIKAKDIWKVAKRLDKDISSRVHPNKYLRDKLIKLPSKGSYPPFTLQDYPKFLTDDFPIEKLEKQKEKEHALREQRRKAIEIAEIERLRKERQTFIDQIQQARLNEVEKCIRDQYSDVEWRFREDVHDLETERLQKHFTNQYENVPPLEMDIESDELVADSEDEKSMKYEKLQRDVDKLEYEVESFLDSIRSERSMVDLT